MTRQQEVAGSEAGWCGAFPLLSLSSQWYALKPGPTHSQRYNATNPPWKNKLLGDHLRTKQH